MDPYKVLGISQSQVKQPSDIDKVRSRAKTLFKRLGKEGKKFDAKKVLEAFDLVKKKLKGNLGEGQYKVLGRSRKERELDKHFNHQTKEIKGNKRLKKALKVARHGSSKERLHLPGDKERIPRPQSRRHRHHRRRRKKRRQVDVNVVQGLARLSALLPQEAKFGKVIKLLYRWMKEYMSLDTREHIFKVLEDVVQFTFLTDDPDTRQDVVLVFQYVLTYHEGWFAKTDEGQLLAEYWNVATVLACQCYTDDAFVLNKTIAKLSESLALLEKRQAEIGVVVVPKKEMKTKQELKDELEDLKDEVKSEDDDNVKSEVKSESEDEERNGVKKEERLSPNRGRRRSSAGGGGAKQDVKSEGGAIKEETSADVKSEPGGTGDHGCRAAPPAANGPRKPLMSRPLSGMSALVAMAAAPVVAGPACSPVAAASPASAGSPGDAEVLDSDSDGPVDLDSDEAVEELDSEDFDEVMVESENDDADMEEIDIGSSQCSSEGEASEGSVEELEGSIFATLQPGKSLELLRLHFVDRCLATLFHQRSLLWAKPKIDAFFQDLFYRRAVFDKEQQTQVEAWQSRIKSNQRLGDKIVGESNNPLEAQRPVVDSREMRTSIGSDANAWANKQTFDSRESSAGKVIR